MGTRILSDSNGDTACLYDSITEWAFGPIFRNRGAFMAEEVVEDFLAWFNITYPRNDVRSLDNKALNLIHAMYVDVRDTRLIEKARKEGMTEEEAKKYITD